MAPNLSLITTLLLVFATAIIGGLIATKLKQSTIVGYIVGGFVVGASGIDTGNRELLEIISNIGVTLLLFTLGVEFSFRRLRKILRVVSWAATAQIIFTMLIVLMVLILFGFSLVPSLFIAAASALSSTAVAVKILSQRGELDTVPGEAATGWLVTQDLAVIPMMIILPSFVALSGPWTILLSLVKAGLVLSVVIALGRIGLPKFLSLVARVGSRELFLLSTVGLVLLSGVTTYALGLSAPLGAFIAGLVIAETSQNHAVFAEIRPLRDLFATIFFVTIGMVLPLPLVYTHIGFIVLLALLVMVIKGGVVTVLLRYLRYHKKSAFLAALTLTQMSEFGFILSSEGVRVGAMTEREATILAATTLLTIVVSTPLLSRSGELYGVYARSIGRWLPKMFAEEEKEYMGKENYPIDDHVVLCGYGRVGKYIGRALLMAKIPYLVVDYNSAVVSRLKSEGIPVVYGDPADYEVLDYAQVDRARAIVIAIPDLHTQELIIGHASTLNKKIKIICRTHHEEDQPHLKSLGVATVIQPEFEAAVTIAERLLGEYGVEQEGIAGKVSRLKIEHGIG